IQVVAQLLVEPAVAARRQPVLAGVAHPPDLVVVAVPALRTGQRHGSGFRLLVEVVALVQRHAGIVALRPVYTRSPMAIVFYISGHGFGHASRDVEIINHLSSDQPVVIRSSVDPGLLKQTLRVPWELRPGPCDTGIVQATSIRHDDPATVRAARDFYATFDERVEAERQRL